MNADARLVAETLDGDAAAFSLLVGRHRVRLRRLAFGVLRDWTEAEDVAQDALIVAHATLVRLREPDRFAAWIGAIAVNLARMRVRSRRAGRTSLEELAGGVRAPAVESAEDAEIVRAALDALSDAQR